MRVLVLPGMDGAEAPRRPFVHALPRHLAASVLTYPQDRSMGYDALVELLRSAIVADGPSVLVAESFAGPIGIRIAASHPDRVRGLVLVGSFAEGPLPRWLRVAVTPLAFALPPPRRVLRRWMLGEDAPEELVELMRREIGAVPATVMARRVREALSVNVTKELAALPMPVMLLEASRDRIVRRRRALAQVRPNVSWEVVDAPHLVLQREPVRCAALVSSFVDGLG